MSQRRNLMEKMSRKIHSNNTPRNYDSPIPDFLIENAYKLYLPLIPLSALSILMYLFMPFNIGIVQFIAIAIPSVIVHEYGHYTVFSHYGVPSEIYLAIFGGFVKPKRRGNMTTRERMNMAIMGCTVNYMIGLFALTIAAFSLFVGPPIMFSLFLSIGVVNMFLAGFNLIPISVLDGGKLYRMWKKLRKRKKQSDFPPQYR